MATHAATDRRPTARPSNVLDRLAERGDGVARLGSFAITMTLAVIFLLFGSLKFIGFEQEGLVGIISNNPLISWVYPVFGQPAGGAMFLGVVEITTGLLILGRVIDPGLSAVGGAIGVLSFFVTVTCLFTTPGVIQPGWEGTLALSPGLGAFLVKDIVLFSACLWLAGTSLTAIQAQRGT